MKWRRWQAVPWFMSTGGFSWGTDLIVAGCACWYPETFTWDFLTRAGGRGGGSFRCAKKQLGPSSNVSKLCFGHQYVLFRANCVYIKHRVHAAKGITFFFFKSWITGHQQISKAHKYTHTHARQDAHSHLTALEKETTGVVSNYLFTFSSLLPKNNFKCLSTIRHSWLSFLSLQCLIVFRLLEKGFLANF